MKKLLLIIGVLVVSFGGMVVLSASTNTIKSSEYYRLEKTDLFFYAESCEEMTVGTSNIEVKANFDERNPIDYNASVVSLEVSGSLRGDVEHTQRASLNEIPENLFLADGSIDIGVVNDAYEHLGFTEVKDANGVICLNGYEMTGTTHFLDEGMYYAD